MSKIGLDASNRVENHTQTNGYATKLLAILSERHNTHVFKRELSGMISEPLLNLSMGMGFALFINRTSVLLIYRCFPADALLNFQISV